MSNDEFWTSEQMWGCLLIGTLLAWFVIFVALAYIAFNRHDLLIW
jgi:hypothetical protein